MVKLREVTFTVAVAEPHDSTQNSSRFTADKGYDIYLLDDGTIAVWKNGKCREYSWHSCGKDRIREVPLSRPGLEEPEKKRGPGRPKAISLDGHDAA